MRLQDVFKYFLHYIVSLAVISPYMEILLKRNYKCVFALQMFVIFLSKNTEEEVLRTEYK